MTADVLNALENGSTIPVVLSNGHRSWFVYIWKNAEGTEYEGYCLYCLNDETGIIENANALDNSFDTLSYEDFTSLDGSSCNTSAGYIDALTDLWDSMCYSLGLTHNGISEESTSEEDVTEKALYYYSE